MNAKQSNKVNLTFNQWPYCTNTAGEKARKMAKLSPTHIDFLDKLLGGGTKKRGVYGIIGPTGVGKSTLAAMIAGKGALNGNLQNKAPHNDALAQGKPWLFLDLRNSPVHPRMLVMSHLTKLDRNFCSGIYPPPPKNGENDSGTRGSTSSVIQNATEMDELFKGIGKRMNGSLFLSSNYKEYLNMGIKSMATFAISHANNFKNSIGGIVIDDFAISWQNNGKLFHKDISERDYIILFVSVFCRWLAEEYKCPVWVTHKMAGKATTRRPADHFSHRDAADCRNLGDHLDACFVMGTPADPDNVFSIQCTKGDPRRTSKKKLLLKHSDNWSGLELANEYVEDNRNKTWKKVNEIKDQFAHGSIHIIDELLEEIERNGGRSPVNPKGENQDKKEKTRCRSSAPIQVG